MASAISRRRESALKLCSLSRMIAEPAITLAQDNPAAPTAPAAEHGDRRRGQRRYPKRSLQSAKKLLAPIAAYPDPLSRKMLPASAYPVQIVQAQRWLDKNMSKNDYSGDRQPELGSRSEGARTLSCHCKQSAPTSTGRQTSVRLAEVNQPQDVAEVIQDLRAKVFTGTNDGSADGRRGGERPSGAAQAEASYISIQPTDPSTGLRPFRTTRELHDLCRQLPLSRLSGLRGRYRSCARALRQQLLENGERVRSIRPGPVIRAGVATSITATSMQAIASTSATT